MQFVNITQIRTRRAEFPPIFPEYSRRLVSFFQEDITEQNSSAAYALGEQFLDIRLLRLWVSPPRRERLSLRNKENEGLFCGSVPRVLYVKNSLSHLSPGQTPYFT